MYNNAVDVEFFSFSLDHLDVAKFFRWDSYKWVLKSKDLGWLVAMDENFEKAKRAYDLQLKVDGNLLQVAIYGSLWFTDHSAIIFREGQPPLVWSKGDIEQVNLLFMAKANLKTKKAFKFLELRRSFKEWSWRFEFESTIKWTGGKAERQLIIGHDYRVQPYLPPYVWSPTHDRVQNCPFLGWSWSENKLTACYFDQNYGSSIRHECRGEITFEEAQKLSRKWYILSRRGEQVRLARTFTTYEDDE